MLRHRFNLKGHCSLRLHQQRHSHHQRHQQLSASNSTFSHYPYEKAAQPRLSTGQRWCRALAFAFMTTAFCLAYSIFILRCVQFGRVLDSVDDKLADLACIGGLAASACLQLLCLVLQLLDNRRQRPHGGCCCGSPGADGDAPNKSPLTSDTESSDAASLISAA